MVLEYTVTHKKIIDHLLAFVYGHRLEYSSGKQVGRLGVFGLVWTGLGQVHTIHTCPDDLLFSLMLVIYAVAPCTVG